MAITLVGTPQAGAAQSGNDVTLTFDGTPAENDVVLLIGGNGDDDGAGDIGPSTAGYTQAVLYQLNDGTPLSVGVWYKVLGASPDSSVTGLGSDDADEATAYGSLVLRGVDTSNVLDATITETGPSTDNPPDLDAVTTQTDDAWVVLGVGKADDNKPDGAPTGYSNLTFAQGTDNNRFTMALCTKEVTTAGAEDPDAFSNWGGSTTWYGFTVAIRPDTGETADPANLQATVDGSDATYTWDASF